MDVRMIALLVAAAGVLGIVVWVLAKIGQALIKVAEALAAATAVVFAAWLMIKAGVWAIRQALTRWRTSLTVLAVAAWWHWWGWPSLALTAGVIAAGVLWGRGGEGGGLFCWGGGRLGGR